MPTNQYTLEKCPPKDGTTVGIYVACKIANKYSKRLPTANELITDFGMSRATAYRWVAGMRAARGLSANTGDNPTREASSG